MKSWKKIISILLINAFILSSLPVGALQGVFADTVTPPSATSTATVSKEVSINPDDIIVAREAGIVKSKFVGKSDKLIIQIQDAHCNYEAQTNITKILESLIKNNSLTFISVEGADGIIDTTWFKSFPDAEVRKEVANYFMKKGEITGPEFLSITTDYPIQLYGAETREYYIQNLNAFTSSYPLKDATEKYLNNIKNVLNKLKGLVYNADLQAMDAKIREHEDMTIQFNDYVRFLQMEAEKYKIDLRKYENLFKLVNVLIYEKKIDFNVTDIERSALINELSKAVPKDTMTDIVNKSVSFKVGKISSAEYYAYIKNLAIKNEIDISAKYPNLYNYIIYNSVYSRIENEKLFNDIKELEIALKEKLFQNDDQRTLEKLSRHIDILLGLINIKLLNNDFEYYKNHKDEFKFDVFFDFIKAKSTQFGLAYNMEAPSNDIVNSVSKLEDFYVIAIKRDKALVDNTLAGMDKFGQKIAVLVTGGFHSEGMSKLLKEQGISYVVVCPTITKNVPTNYIQILTNQKTSFEDILTGVNSVQDVTQKGTLAPYSIASANPLDDKDYKGRVENVRDSWLFLSLNRWLNGAYAYAKKNNFNLQLSLFEQAFRIAAERAAAIAILSQSMAINPSQNPDQARVVSIDQARSEVADIMKQEEFKKQFDIAYTTIAKSTEGDKSDPGSAMTVTGVGLTKGENAAVSEAIRLAYEKLEGKLTDPNVAPAKILGTVNIDGGEYERVAIPGLDAPEFNKLVFHSGRGGVFVDTLGMMHKHDKKRIYGSPTRFDWYDSLPTNYRNSKGENVNLKDQALRHEVGHIIMMNEAAAKGLDVSKYASEEEVQKRYPITLVLDYIKSQVFSPKAIEDRRARLMIAKKNFGLTDAEVAYAAQMWEQHLKRAYNIADRIPLRIMSGSKAADDENYDPASIIGNFILAAVLSDAERKNLLGAYKYSNLINDDNLAKAKEARVILNGLDGGKGENVGRLKFKKKIANLLGINPNEVEIAAKGTDLGFMLRGYQGQDSVFISIAEAKLMQAVYMARNNYYKSIKFQPIVNNDSEPSYVQLLSSICIEDRFDTKRIQDNTQRSYRELLTELGIKFSQNGEVDGKLDASYVADLPGIGRDDLNIGIDKDVPHQPGGHGQVGFSLLFDACMDKNIAKDADPEIRVFYNGDNINSRANPYIVGAMLNNNWPIVKLTTPATPIDSKGGKDGIRAVLVWVKSLAKKIIKWVPDQMEAGDVKIQGQISEFYSAGQDEQAGRQPFNTNIFYINIVLLNHIFQDILKEGIMTESEVSEIISPILIEKTAKFNKKDGKYYVPIDGAIGTAIHNVNNYFMLSDDSRLKDIFKKYKIDRLLYFVDVPRTDFFTPIKKASDFWFQNYSNYYKNIDTEKWVIEAIEEKDLPQINVYDQDSNWKDVQDWIDSLGSNADVSKLKSLTLWGALVIKDAVFQGNVVLENYSGNVVDITKYSIEHPELFVNGRVVLDNVRIFIGKDGEITITKLDNNTVVTMNQGTGEIVTYSMLPSGAMLKTGRVLTAREHADVNAIIASAYTTKKDGQEKAIIVDDTLADATQKKMEVIEIPGLKAYENIIGALPGCGGVISGHEKNRTYLTPEGARWYRSPYSQVLDSDGVSLRQRLVNHQGAHNMYKNQNRARLEILSPQEALKDAEAEEEAIENKYSTKDVLASMSAFLRSSADDSLNKEESAPIDLNQLPVEKSTAKIGAGTANSTVAGADMPGVEGDGQIISEDNMLRALIGDQLMEKLSPDIRELLAKEATLLRRCLEERDIALRLNKSSGATTLTNDTTVIITFDTGITEDNTTPVVKEAEAYVNRFWNGKLISIRGTGQKLIDAVEAEKSKLPIKDYRIVNIVGDGMLTGKITAKTFEDLGEKDSLNFSKVLNVAKPADGSQRYIPIIGLYAAAIRIACDDPADYILRTLNEIGIDPDTNTNFDLRTIEDMIKSGRFRFLPRMLKVNPNELPEAYKAALAAVTSL